MVMTINPNKTRARTSIRLSQARVSILVCVTLLFPSASSSFAQEKVDYVNQIKPLLRARCYACHGALKQEAGLRLDTAELANKGSDSGVVIQRGDAAASLVLRRVTATESERMPPQGEGEPLSAEQIALLSRWIDGGATGPADEQPEADPEKHWAFQRITRPTVPDASTGWVRNPIDAFLHQQHQRQGIEPQPEAPRIVLLRRLYFDLIGLPPTLDEIAACEADDSPQWYEQLAKRLLDDPRHGERWARHWMDIWRYSDWWGLGDQLRNSQKHIWHWRDWIVESLNEDTRYDEMIRLMLAADELHPSDMKKLRATGFLARNYVLFNRPQWMEETVEHVSKGFLGLTMNCVRCHSHKYDPFEHTDYYRLRAFFEPYHARLDIVPGETDLSQDGVPRVFDGLLEEPTYLYIRGDERNPDKSKVITPGVPALLAFSDLKIEPVSLPADAWQPERRPWVLDAYIAAAQKRVPEAELAVRKAEEKVAAAIKSEELAKKKQTEEAKQTPPAELSENLIIADKFETLDASRWKLFGGEWVHQPGRLEQKLDGATNSILRLLEKQPRDFDATIRFTTLGGSQWRSVGLSFDVSQLDPTQSMATTDSEQNVYVSAVSGGSKIQASIRSEGNWQFPGGQAMRAMPISLNQEYTLRVQVRNQLVNASLNGESLIAWESTLARRDGALQVFTFDALAVIHEVTLKALEPSVALRQPGAQTFEMAQKSVAEAQLEQALAKAGLAVAQAELGSVERRAEAQRAQWNSSDQSVQEKTHAAAIRSERLLAAAQARHSVIAAQHALLRAQADAKEPAEKALKDAQDALDKALMACEAEVAATDQYAKFSGAMWTPTRFFNSAKDDPEVKFPSQSSGRRTALANWITDHRNPLTARVAVNHLWTRHFGQPLVATVFDFGRNGTPPIHPELLDWLASELIDSGWSMKHIHTLIVNSAAYRMSSSLKADRQHATSGEVVDPENRFWWRRVPIRLESQLVRDSLLSLSGTLDSTMGGPSIPSNQQEDSKRRSLYFFHSNNERNLFLSTFDEALVRDCYRREQSIVPQQALALSNSSQALEAAENIAARLGDNSSDDETFVRSSFRLMTGINPNSDELAAGITALEAWRKIPNTDARANFVWVLINHNDFITLR